MSKKTARKIAPKKTKKISPRLLSHGWLGKSEEQVFARNIAGGFVTEATSFSELLELDEGGEFWKLAAAIERANFKRDGIKDQPEHGAKHAELLAAYWVGLEIGRLTAGAR